MSDIKLSYVVTTYNKFPYLQEVLIQLISCKNSDEEIIVTDGKSNDGTIEWLKQLLDEGKIDVFITEKDHGEAHGFNKAMMLARGELIKLITADDIFYYPAISKCKEFMLDNQDIDVVTSAIISADLRQKGRISLTDGTLSNFENWKNNKASYFYFNCIPIMIRRSQLPKLGLLHTSFKMVDYEYSMRISKVSNIVLYTNPIALHVVNNTSNLFTMDKIKMSDEYIKTDFMYDKVRLKILKDYTFLELIMGIVTKIRYSIDLKTRIKTLLGMNKPQADRFHLTVIPSSIPEAFNYLYKLLEEENKKKKGEFMHS